MFSHTNLKLNTFTQAFVTAFIEALEQRTAVSRGWVTAPSTRLQKVAKVAKGAVGHGAFFLYRFPKNKRATIMEKELRELNFVAKVYLGLSDADISVAIRKN